MVLRKNEVTAKIPTADDVRLARESGLRLQRFVKSDCSLRVRVVDAKSETLELPSAAAELLLRLLRQMAEGNAVTVLSTDALLTTQQVADLLGVSRPFVVKEIEEKRLPARKVGTRRRVVLGDLLRYRQRSDVARQAALDGLAALDEELGLA